MLIWKFGLSFLLLRYGGVVIGIGQFEILGKQGLLRDMCMEFDFNFFCRM